MLELHYLWTTTCLMLLSLNSSFGSDIDVSTVIDFTNLHLSYCTTSQLCTARSDTTLLMNKRSCCQMCSCENECRKDDTCCPDILLRGILGNITESTSNAQERYVNSNATERDVISTDEEQNIFSNATKPDVVGNAGEGGNTFGNVTERDIIGNTAEHEVVANNMDLRNNTQCINHTAGFRNNEDFLPSEYNTVYDCVDCRLRSRDIWSDSPRIKNAYQMVTQCPKHLSADSVSTDRCTVSATEYHKGMNVSNSRDLEELVNIVTPVSSLATLVTYRNIYCLACQENLISENAFIPWRAFVTCSYATVGRLFFSNPYEAFIYILENVSFNHCNIIMKPPESIQNFIPKKCSPSDIRTCPLGTDSRLDLFCRSFNLPVRDDYDARKYVIYRNIACYLCNKNTTFVEKCRDNVLIHEEYFLELNINHKPRVELLLSDPQENTSEADIANGVDISENMNTNNLNFNDNPSVNNSDMERFKTKTATQENMEHLKRLSSLYCNRKYEKCGDIVCPDYFFQSEDRCIPSFASFEGLYFSFHVEIKPTRFLTEPDLEIFLPLLYRLLENYSNSFFNEFNFGVWYDMDEDVLKNVVVVIDYISTEPDYFGAVTVADTFLLYMKNVHFRTSLGIVDYIYRLTDDYVYTSSNMVLDLNNMPLKVYKKAEKFSGSMKEMKIERRMGCYRVVVEQTVPSNSFLITGQFVSRVEMGLTKTVLRDIICFEEAVDVAFNTSDAYFFKGFAGNHKTVIENVMDTEEISQDKGDNDNLKTLRDKRNITLNLDAGSTNEQQKLNLLNFLGTREVAITATVACIVLVIVIIRKYKKRVSRKSNVTIENIPMDNLSKF